MPLHSPVPLVRLQHCAFTISSSITANILPLDYNSISLHYKITGTKAINKENSIVGKLAAIKKINKKKCGISKFDYEKHANLGGPRM